MCTADGFLTSPIWGGACSVLATSRLSALPLPSFCRCPPALGGCPRVFLLSQAVLAVVHAFGGLLTVCAFQMLRLVPLGGLSCPRRFVLSFLPCYPVGGLCPMIRCRVLPFRLLRSLLPVIYSLCALGAVLTCQRSRGRSLRLSAVGGFYFGCRSPTYNHFQPFGGFGLTCRNSLKL